MRGKTDHIRNTEKQQNGFSLSEFLLSLFDLDLRDKLSEQKQDQSDAVYTWGL